ncbi:MAG TPA: dipeptidase PepE [Terriglobales bacterium]|jgi:dipeptidase E
MSGKRLLLISSSTVHGSGYLDHCAGEIRDFLHHGSRVAFAPFALHDRGAYAAKVEERFRGMGFSLLSLHSLSNPARVLDQVDAVFVGGGNTFRLLNELYQTRLLEPIRRSASAGLPYIGSSAGSIVAGPSLKTTKDMPVVQPPSFEALGLVAFQISPHYLDPDPNTTHMGETQEERILQFLEENEAPVAGLREASILRVENGAVRLKGTAPARIFRRGQPPVEISPGQDLTSLLAEPVERATLVSPGGSV